LEIRVKTVLAHCQAKSDVRVDGQTTAALAFDIEVTLARPAENYSANELVVSPLRVDDGLTTLYDN
jgi:hypothetical protein